VESGLVGLTLLFTSWIVICWRSLKALLAGTPTAWLFAAGLAVVAVYLLNAVTVDMRFFSFVPAIPWFVLGLLRRHQLSGGTVGFES
jgi:hypothetical protein